MLLGRMKWCKVDDTREFGNVEFSKKEHTANRGDELKTREFFKIHLSKGKELEKVSHDKQKR